MSKAFFLSTAFSHRLVKIPQSTADSAVASESVVQLIPSELKTPLPRQFDDVRLRDFHLRYTIMRLIHTSKLELYTFFKDPIPP